MPNTIITITLEIPEEISQRATQQAARQGTTITEIVRQRLEEYAAEGNPPEPRSEAESSEKEGGTPFKRGFKVSEFDRNWRPTPAEFEQSLASVAEARRIAEEIGQRYPDLKVDAVELIREGRRF